MGLDNMKPFPSSYVGRITQITKRSDGSLSLNYWARRDDGVVEVIWSSVEAYQAEFPGRPIEVALPDAAAPHSTSSH